MSTDASDINLALEDYELYLCKAEKQFAYGSWCCLLAMLAISVIGLGLAAFVDTVLQLITWSFEKTQIRYSWFIYAILFINAPFLLKGLMNMAELIHTKITHRRFHHAIPHIPCGMRKEWLRTQKSRN